MNNKFSAELQRLRLKKGMTQDELAKALKMSRSRIGMYESGKRQPDFETLEQIADFFNVPMSSLIDQKEKPHDPAGIAGPDGYGDLTDAEKAEVDRYIRFILSSRGGA